MKNWAKWTWTEFYKDYVLPTNWSTKNPLFLKIFTNEYKNRVRKELTTWDIESDLNLKLKNSKIFWWIHVFWAIWLLWIDLKDWNISLIPVVINLLVNIYPILIQINVHQRVWKILAHRKNNED